MGKAILGFALRDVIGELLPGETEIIGLTLHVRCDEPVTMTVEKYVSEQEAQKLLRVIKKYQLVEVASAQQTQEP